MVITLRSPAPGLIVHSDRGSPYASADHQALLAEQRLIGSMSRKGNCWDNAVMERVWQRDYANVLEARTDISDTIVNFDNSPRLHSTLNYQSPADYERNTVKPTA